MLRRPSNNLYNANSDFWKKEPRWYERFGKRCKVEAGRHSTKIAFAAIFSMVGFLQCNEQYPSSKDTFIYYPNKALRWVTGGRNRDDEFSPEHRERIRRLVQEQESEPTTWDPNTESYEGVAFNE